MIAFTSCWHVCSLFIDVSKIDKAVSRHLSLDNSDDISETKVTVCPYEGIWDTVHEAAKNGSRIWVRIMSENFICVQDALIKFVANQF